MEHNEDRDWDTVGSTLLDALKANPTPFIYGLGFVALLIVLACVS